MPDLDASTEKEVRIFEINVNTVQGVQGVIGALILTDMTSPDLQESMPLRGR
jgi:hypothetical protein